MDDGLGRDVLFCRMIGILTPGELDALATKTVAVPGAGGAGFTHAECMVRMGIGRIKIADFDTFGPENMGRQFGATRHTIGKSKVGVLAERIKSINPAIVVETFDGVTAKTVDDFLEGVDFVCDAIDYWAIQSRRLMYREARGRGIPVALAGPQGFGANLHIFDPKEMSFDDYFALSDAQSDEEMRLNFGTGLHPGQLYRHSLDDPNLDFRNRGGSVLSLSCLLCTSLVTTVALARLLGKPTALKPVPHLYQVDIAAAKFEELHIPEGVRGIKANPQAYLR